MFWRLCEEMGYAVGLFSVGVGGVAVLRIGLFTLHF